MYILWPFVRTLRRDINRHLQNARRTCSICMDFPTWKIVDVLNSFYLIYIYFFRIERLYAGKVSVLFRISTAPFIGRVARIGHSVAIYLYLFAKMATEFSGVRNLFRKCNRMHSRVRTCAITAVGKFLDVSSIYTDTISSRDS